MDRRLLIFTVPAGIFILDRLTKIWIESNITLWDTHVVIPGFFNIIYTRNRGIAFGLLSEGTGIWRNVLLVGVAVIVLVVVGNILWRLPPKLPPGQRFTRLALILVLGGALGNLYDRVRVGSVTDFLDFYIGSYHWPAFNVADSAITIGAALIVLDLLLSKQCEVRT